MDSNNPPGQTPLPLTRNAEGKSSTAFSPSMTSKDEAQILVRQLLLGFPNALKNAPDQEGYVVGLCTILCLYDKIDAALGVADCLKTSSREAPTFYDLRQSCERMADDRARLERLRRANEPPPPQKFSPEHEAAMREQIATLINKKTIKTMLEEMDPAPDPATGKHPPGTILENYPEAVKLYGTPIGWDDPRHSRFGGVGGKAGPMDEFYREMEGRGLRFSSRQKRNFNPRPYAGPPWVPYTHDQLRAVYGIHQSFKEPEK
jgi:hypothetical protein